MNAAFAEISQQGDKKQTKEEPEHRDSPRKGRQVRRDDVWLQEEGRRERGWRSALTSGFSEGLRPLRGVLKGAQYKGKRVLQSQYG